VQKGRESKVRERGQSSLRTFHRYLPRADASAQASRAMAHVDSRAEYNERLLQFLDRVDGTLTRRAIMLPGTMKPGGSVLDATVGVE